MSGRGSAEAPVDEAAGAFDIEFFWDPVCPFSWLTSRWIVEVADETGYRVDWRFISLRLLNKDRDYAREFPPGYEEGHTNGLRVLRVAAAVRAELGREPLGPLVTAFGESYWDAPKGSGVASRLSTPEHLRPVLAAAGIPDRFVEALDDESWDAELDEETELALSRTGRDVGTPIITFRPPDGPSFFGPVISRIPDREESLALWNAVTTLAMFDGFSEMKRSLRERPRLRIFGGDERRPVEDWERGSRRADRPGR